MNKEQQRIAIAELCGWTDLKWIGQAGDKSLYGKPKVRPGGISVPDYTEDLNAMAEAEHFVFGLEWSGHWFRWEHVVAEMAKQRGSMPLTVWIAKMSASQRAEAFLRTMGKWVE